MCRSACDKRYGGEAHGGPSPQDIELGVSAFLLFMETEGKEDRRRGSEAPLPSASYSGGGSGTLPPSSPGSHGLPLATRREMLFSSQDSPVIPLRPTGRPDSPPVDFGRATYSAGVSGDYTPGRPLPAEGHSATPVASQSVGVVRASARKGKAKGVAVKVHGVFKVGIVVGVFGSLAGIIPPVVANDPAKQLRWTAASIDLSLTFSGVPKKWVESGLGIGEGLRIWHEKLAREVISLPANEVEEGGRLTPNEAISFCMSSDPVQLAFLSTPAPSIVPSGAAARDLAMKTFAKEVFNTCFPDGRP